MVEKNKTGYPSLKTKRLSLRAPTLEDSSRYHEILSIPEVTRYTNFRDAQSVRRSEKFVRWMTKLFQSEKGCAWIIEELGSMKIIGAIRIDKIDKRSRYGVIGFELDPAYWGRGLMREALAEIVRYSFNRFDLNRLEAWTLAGNPASDKTLLKNGFSYEGTLRQKSWFKGNFHNLRMFSRLAQDAATTKSDEP